MKLQHYPSPTPTPTAVLILPGGGYGNLSLPTEGDAPAAWLNARNIDAWVLHYTYAHPPDTPAPIYPTPLTEAQDAVRQIRNHQQNQSAPNQKLGIWGWSAGGHLAAVTATTPETAGDVDFVILAYPVITMTDDSPPTTTHRGSRDNLLGPSAPPALQREMSAQNRVTDMMPAPTFLFHTAADDKVPVRNALVFADALARHCRPFELLVLPRGRHGVGMALRGDEENDEDQRACASWTVELERWIRQFC